MEFIIIAVIVLAVLGSLFASLFETTRPTDESDYTVVRGYQRRDGKRVRTHRRRKPRK